MGNERNETHEVISPPHRGSPSDLLERARAAGAIAHERNEENEQIAGLLSNELRRLWVAVEKGRASAAAREGPLPAAWIERFRELHLERMRLRWELDTAVFNYPDDGVRLRRKAQLCDEECHAIRAATKTREAVFPSEGAQRGMHGVNAAVRCGIGSSVEDACRAAISAAVEQVYGDGGRTA